MTGFLFPEESNCFVLPPGLKPIGWFLAAFLTMKLRREPLRFIPGGNEKIPTASNPSHYLPIGLDKSSPYGAKKGRHGGLPLPLFALHKENHPHHPPALIHVGCFHSHFPFLHDDLFLFRKARFHRLLF